VWGLYHRNKEKEIQEVSGDENVPEFVDVSPKINLFGYFFCGKTISTMVGYILLLSYLAYSITSHV
jgi:hypothetical protein